MRNPSATLVTLVLLLGCGTGPAPGTWHRPALQLLVEPSDLATGVTAGPFRVSLVTLGGSFDPSTAHALERAVSLAEWPSGTAVSATVASDSTHVSISPNSPLAPGWYRFELSPTDPLTTFEVLDRWGGRETDMGTTATFHVGHLPVLIATAEPDSLDGTTTRVTISGSEPLSLVASADIHTLIDVSTPSGPGTCSYQMQTDSPNDDLSYADGLRFSCIGIELHQPLTLRVHPGLIAADGSPLRDIDGNTEGVASWTPATDGRFSPHTLTTTSPLVAGAAP